MDTEEVMEGGPRLETGDRRGLDQEEPSWSHSEADGERSHGGGMASDSRGPTNGGAGGGGARGGDGEPTSQEDVEDPGGQVGAEVSVY